MINRLRSIAEHGGMERSEGSPAPPRTRCASRWWSRFFLVPFHIGWHLAHHVDAGVPMRHLPEYHRALRESGYLTPGLEFPTLPRALARPSHTEPGREPGRPDVEYVSSGPWSSGSRTLAVS